MGRVAIFVDAGYLFAQGSTAITGANRPRSTLVLDEQVIVTELVAFAKAKADPNSLLRVYWYDAASGQWPNAAQIRLGEMDDVKMRLGVLNSSGEQKGVDSLIIADLIELARNSAIESAVLMSGDEDLRVGVQVIQTFGIRVHLLGITAGRDEAQSRLLVREADTCNKWDAEKVSTFLSIREAPAPVATPIVAEMQAIAASAPSAPGTATESIVKAAEAFLVGLGPQDVSDIITVYEAERTIPYDFDRKLLASCRTALSRDLEIPERRLLRQAFLEALQTKAKSTSRDASEGQRDGEPAPH